jgi:hypothetical protein
VTDWSRDGAFLLFNSQGADTAFDLWALPMTGDRKPFTIVKTKFNEGFGTFSPDGHYVAYSSNESGQSEIYVQEFPEARNKWQISTAGGSQPFWRGDGRELYYRSGARVIAVPLPAGDGFTAGAPAPLFEARFASVLLRAHYRPTPDGQRFLLVAPLGDEASQSATVMLNWTAALRN